MYSEVNMDFDIVLSFTIGILLGGLSYNILFVILFAVFGEIFMMAFLKIKFNEVMYVNRVINKIFYLGGWIIGRILFLNETGLEIIEQI